MKESSPPVSAMATPTNSSGNVVDEFQEAFQHCLNVLTKEEANPNNDKEESRTEVEQTTLRFVDLARQMEAFFLQKRFLLSALRPEMVVKEEINELRIELARKDELLKRHYDKINVWQNLLMDLQGYSKSPAQVAGVSTVTPGMATPGGSVGVNVGVPPGAMMPSSSMQPSQMSNVVNNNPMSGGSMTMQQQLQQQLQQQQMQQQLQQQQLQQQQMQQMQGGMSGLGGGGVGMVPGSQQAMFMQQAAMGGARASPFGGQPNAAGVLQGPLAYLEKTTSNIDLVAGMTDGRR